MVESLIPVLAGAIAAATPLIFAGLGELIAERTGVINLGVEGMMLTGAIAGFAAAADTGYGAAIGLPVGAIAGAATAMIFAFFALSLAANQAACGLALALNAFGADLVVTAVAPDGVVPGCRRQIARQQFDLAAPTAFGPRRGPEIDRLVDGEGIDHLPAEGLQQLQRRLLHQRTLPLWKFNDRGGALARVEVGFRGNDGGGVGHDGGG